MAVIMISDVPGADAGLIDGLRAAGVPEAMAAFPGFVSHISGATETGYRVVEVWDSAGAHQAWFAAHIAPSLPPGMKTTPPQYIDVALTVPES